MSSCTNGSNTARNWSATDATPRVLDADVDPRADAGHVRVPRRRLRRARADRHAARLVAARRRELDRIRQQVDEDLPDALLVTDRRQTGGVAAHGVGHLDLLRARLRRHQLERRAHRLPDLEGGVLDWRPLRIDPGEVEHLADETEQMSAARPGALEVPALAVRQRTIDLHVEQVVIAEDRVQRCADLVADRGEEPALRRTGGDRLGPRPLCGGRGRLQERIRRAACGEVARHLGEAEQLAFLVAERRERDTRPERRAIRADAFPLAGVLAVLPRVVEVLLRRPVLRAAGHVQHPEMPALRLALRPPLHEARALTPEDDPSVRVHEKDRVVANVLGELRERPRRDLRPCVLDARLVEVRSACGDLPLAFLRLGETRRRAPLPQASDWVGCSADPLSG